MVFSVYIFFSYLLPLLFELEAIFLESIYRVIWTVTVKVICDLIVYAIFYLIFDVIKFFLYSFLNVSQSCARKY